MNGSQPNSESTNQPELRVGLAASGSSGSWNIDVDHTYAEPEVWFFQMQSPFTYLYFELHHPRVIGQALCLLESRGPSVLPPRVTRARTDASGSIYLGRFADSPVTLVADDEFSDRFFVRIGDSGNPSLHLTIGSENLTQFTAALRQVRDELEQDRLLDMDRPDPST